MLNSIKKHFLLILCGFTLSLLLTLFFYFYSFSSKANTYVSYVQNNTVGYLITQPSKIQRYIRKLAPSATRWIKQIPKFTSLQPGPIRLDWFHNLPREASLLFHYLPGTGFETYFIIREKRNSTAFIEELHASHFVKEFRFIEWKSHQFTNIQRDIWLNEGFVYGKPLHSQMTLNQENLPHLQNNHVIEILWINTGQNVSVILEQVRFHFPSLRYNYSKDWELAIENIHWIYSYLDLVEDNLISGILRIKPISPTQLDEIQQSVLSFQEWLQSQLPSPMKFEFTEKESSGGEMMWDIHFYDFEGHLKRALGNYSD